MEINGSGSRSHFQKKSDAVVTELYCGAGFFTVAIAPHVQKFMRAKKIRVQFNLQNHIIQQKTLNGFAHAQKTTKSRKKLPIFWSTLPSWFAQKRN